MLEKYSDLWSEPCSARAITTNGFIKKNGALVMGRGCAKEARDMFPGLDLYLGKIVNQSGNKVHVVQDPSVTDKTSIPLVTFPVKNVWWEQAIPKLIERSAGELLIETILREWKVVVLPRPGCGNGKLSWETVVRPILSNILDDRFLVVHNDL